MAKKDLKKLAKEWACPQGCDVTKKLCHHLDDILQNPRNPGELSTEVRRQYKDHLIAESEVPNMEQQYDDYEKKLEGVGFKDYEIDLIMDRFVHEMSIRDITEKHGYLRTQDVVRLLEKLKGTLQFVYNQGD